jgi:two-component system response regulator AtoC
MDHFQTLVADHPVMPGFVPGHHKSILAVNAMVAELARTDIPVLILGESGTGKDIYARLIHHLSPQHNSQLQKINCSAFKPADLMTNISKFAPTSSDSAGIPAVYLDNIQELDLAGQRALLSQISESESAAARYASVARLISSTIRTLEPEVAAGHFRRELYFRLNGAFLRLPPLRERTEDIPILVEYFLNKHSEIMKRNTPSLNDTAFHVLMNYAWPGNIRELESFVRKIVVFGDVQRGLDELKSLPVGSTTAFPFTKAAPLKIAARAASKEAERELIIQALERTHWNRKRAARDLKISYKALLYKIKQIGLGNDNTEV